MFFKAKKARDANLIDWYKTKNILIFVLLILNIALFSVYYRTDTQDKIISNRAKDNVVSILETNNIHLDKKIIPKAPESFVGFYLERAVRTNSGMVEKLLGQGYSYDEKTGEYKTSSKTLLINGGNFEFSDNMPKNPPEKTDENYIKEFCQREMDRIGIDKKLYVFGGLNKVDKGVKAIFSAKIDSYEIFDSFISFEISNSGINKISGKNIVVAKNAKGVATKVFGINSVLLDVPSNELISKSRINKIISIKLGYYVGASEEKYSSVLAIPIWQIATDSGTILYYDARNGKKLE